MSAISKEGLKRAKAAIGSKDYSKVKSECLRILQFESDNYTALIYLGLALQNLEELESCESYLLKAKSLQPEGLLAYQGLIKLYENPKFDLEKWVDIVEETRNLYLKSNKGDRVLDLTLKLIENYSRSQSTTTAYMTELNNLRPESAYYDLISVQDQFPKPTETLLKLSQLTKQLDEKKIVDEVEVRRRRLSEDSMETIKKKVITEVLLNSKYMSYMEELLSLKKQLTKEEILACTENYLVFLKRVLDSSLAGNKLDYYYKLVHTVDQAISEESISPTVVIIKLEFSDVYDSDGYDREFLQTYSDQVKSDKSLTKYLDLILLNDFTFVPSTKEDLVQFEESLLKEDWLTFKLNVLSTHYFKNNEYGLAYKVAGRLHFHLNSLFSNQSPLSKLEVGYKLIQAVSLMKFGTKYFPNAQQLFDWLVQKESNNLQVLEGYCDLLLNQNRFENGQEICLHALNLQPDHAKWLSNLAWTQFNLGAIDQAKTGLEQALQTNPEDAITHYRMGRLYWTTNQSGKADAAKAFTSFIKAAQLDSQLAQPYLYLAYYYQQVQQDTARTLKCLLKYLSLDRTCLEVYQLLIDIYSSNSDLIEMEKFLNMASTYCSESHWVWLRLGYLNLHLNRLDLARTNFQSCVRKQNSNFQAWAGLGQTYLLQGRFKAALGAFQRSKNLSTDDNPTATYHLALINLKLEDHQAGLYHLDKLLETEIIDTNLKVAAVRLAAEGCLDYAKRLFLEGRFGRTVDLIVTSLQRCIEGFGLDPKLVGWYELVGDSLALAIRCKSNLNLIPTNLLKLIANFVQTKRNATDLPSFLELDLLLQLLDQNQGEMEDIQLQQAVLCGAATAYKFTIYLTTESDLRASLAHKLSTVYDLLSTHHHTFKPLSIQLAKLALDLQPDSITYWIQLAKLLQPYDVKLTQHLYLTAIQLDGKDPVAWTNYGYLAHQLKDHQLASQIFAKAKQLDPTYLPAWLGALLTDLQSKSNDQTNLIKQFEHTIQINENVSMTILKLYPTFLFHHYLNLQLPVPEPQFSVGLDAIQKYCQVETNDPTALNLLGLYLEQKLCFDQAAIHFDSALQLLIQLQQLHPERTELLDQFVKLQLNRGRSLLQNSNFEAALQAFTTASNCIQQLGAQATPLELTQLHLNTALAHFNLNDFNLAIGQFELALPLTANLPIFDKLVRTTLAKSLWRLGTSESQQIAKQQLLACVENNTLTTDLLITLSAMATATQDFTLFQAAQTELNKLKVNSKTEDTYPINLILAIGYNQFQDFKKGKCLLTTNTLKFPHQGDRYLDLAQFLSIGTNSKNDGDISKLLITALEHYHRESSKAEHWKLVLDLLANLYKKSNQDEDLLRGKTMEMKAKFLCPWQ